MALFTAAGDFLSSSPLSEIFLVWERVLPSSSIPRILELSYKSGHRGKRGGERLANEAAITLKKYIY